MAKTAITPTRAEDYPEWFQQVIRAADLAENSDVRGCMVIKPWGYSIWENMQRGLDGLFKATGHENAYFPLFIPLSFLQKEADHVARELPPGFDLDPLTAARAVFAVVADRIAVGETVKVVDHVPDALKALWPDETRH